MGIIEIIQNKKPLKSIQEYKLFEILDANENELFYSAENDKQQKFYIHQFKAESLAQVSILFRSFTKKISSKFLLNPIEYFASLEDSTYSMNYVNEEIIMTMEKEFF